MSTSDMALTSVVGGFPEGIYHTDTVQEAMRILSLAWSAPIPPEGDLPAIAYYDVLGAPPWGVPLPDTPFTEILVRQYQLDWQSLATFLQGADRSPTFCRLKRLAILEQRLPFAGPGRWSARLVQSLAYSGNSSLYPDAFVADPGRRVVTIPYEDSPAIGGRHYLLPGGELRPMGGVYYALGAFVSALTGITPPNLALWSGADGGVDAWCVEQFGAGERGVVGYLVQRILRELGFQGLQPISPLPFEGDSIVKLPTDVYFSEAMQRAFDAIGGISAVENHARQQDEALEKLFPFGG